MMNWRREQEYWRGRRSGGAEPGPDVMVERFNDRCPHYFEPAAQIIPDRDAQFVTGLGEAEERIAAVPAVLSQIFA
jgi:hypothetical protein